jgi:hypothetical protein
MISHHSPSQSAYERIVRRLLFRIQEWSRSWANAYAAAHIYEELRHLSDAELSRRGLSRATLAQDLWRREDQHSEHPTI